MVYNPVNPADALDQSVIDINDAFDKVARWFRGATAPSSPEPQMKWFNTTDSILYVRSTDNTKWVPCKLMDSETGVIVSDGTESITICAPATLSEDYVLKLPPAQGGSQQFLRNDGAGNLEWVAGGASGVTELDGLSDVAVTGAPSGSYLQKSGATWIDVATLDVTDLSITGQTRGDLIVRTLSGWSRLALGTNGQVLTSDGTDVEWADPTGGGGGTTLAALSDTVITSATDGEYLRYSGGSWRDSGLLAADITTPTSATGDILIRGVGGYERLALGTNGQVLTSDGTAPGWSTPATGGASAIGDLTDVQITGAADGEYLRFSSGAWRDSALLLNDLEVANETAGDLAYFNGAAWNRLPRGSNGQFLRATASNVQWQTVALGAQNLNELSDVALGTLATNQVLRFNGVNWANTQLAVGHLSISGTARGDLMVRGIASWQRLARGTSGQVLSSNGTDLVWVDPAGGGSSTLAGLADVSLASPGSGQYLRHNGGTWSNSGLLAVDLLTGSDAVGDILVRGASGYTRLAIGTLGQVLTSSGSTATWADAPGGGSSSLSGLSDVALGTPATGEFLRYNGSAWVDAAIQLSDLNAGSETLGDLAYFNGSDWSRLPRGANGQFLRATSSSVSWQTVAVGSTTLNGLSDTFLGTPATGEYLRYSGGLWRDSALLASDLTITGQARGDVIVRSATTWTRLPIGANGQVLTSNGTDVTWADPAGGGGSSTLAGLADVLLGTPVLGEYLRHDGSSWVDSPLLLGDVTASGQTAGDLAYFDGSDWNRLARGSTGQFLRSTAGSVAWETVSLGGASTLDELTDVDVSTTSPTAGDVLRHSGVGWFNAKLGIGDLSTSGTSTGDLMVRGAGGAWERLAIGSGGQILYSTGASPIWLSNTLTVLTDTSIISPQAGQYLRRGPSVWQNVGLQAADLLAGSDAEGDLLVRGASAYGRLAVGTNGQVLTSNGTTVTWADPASGGGSSSLGGLTDVSLISPANGEFLRYNGSAWTDSAIQLADLNHGSEATGDVAYFNGSDWTRLPRGASGQFLRATSTSVAWQTVSVGSTTLTGLTDTTLGTLVNGEYLRYSNGQWRDSSLLASDLTITGQAQGDLIVRTATTWARLGLGANGQVLTSNGTDVTWATPSGSGTTLAGLSDVSISAPPAGNYLRYNGSDWANSSLLAVDILAGSDAVGDLLVRGGSGYTRLGIGANGQVLTSDGTTAAWSTPSGGGGPITLDDLTNTQITSPQAGEQLRFNGTVWANSPTLLADLATASQALGDLAYFNGSDWTRLPRGANGQVLKATSTTIEWANASGSLAGLSDTSITVPGAGEYLRWNGSTWQDSPLLLADLYHLNAANGDIIVRSGGTFTRLAVGSEGQVLSSSGGAVQWADPAGGGGSTTLGGLSDVTITSASTGDYLRHDGQAWKDSAGIPFADLSVPGENRGDLAYFDGSDWNRFSIGTAGQVLSSNGSTIEWSTPSGGGASTLNDLTDVSTVGAATGDLLVRGASSWGILDASAAASNSVLEWTGSALQYRATTGTGDVVRHTAPTFAGTVNGVSFVATGQNRCQSMAFSPITGGLTNYVTIICPTNGAPYNLLLPPNTALPSSGTSYLKINSSGQISISAT